MRPTKQAVYSSRTADKFVVRLPDGMRGQIEVLAKERHQSMNSYMIAKLERAIAIDCGVHTPYTPVIGMAVEHKASGSVGVIESLIVQNAGMSAKVGWVTLCGNAPDFRESILLTDLRPYVV